MSKGTHGEAVSQVVEDGGTIPLSVNHKIVYFVHDLSDPAVHRRVRMLQVGGGDIVLLGFRRSPQPVHTIDNLRPIDLGKTTSQRFAMRVGSVLEALVTLDRHRVAISGATTIIARNLEMLVIALLAQRRFAPGASLVYECLDIHRLMIAPILAGRLLRRLEQALLRRCDLLIVSSPAYISAYFECFHRDLPRSLLLENKVLGSECDAGQAVEEQSETVPLGPPWRIGWYGSVRCRRSLHLLAGLVDRLPGRVEVIIRGNPDPVVMPDLHEVVAASPGLALQPPYDRRTDLRRLYASVHFAWAMDFFDATGNSRWLLPNRLYEGGLHGALPIALQSAETGRWLNRFGAGVLLVEPVQDTLVDFFETLDASRYLSAKDAFSRIPRSAFVHDDDDCAEIYRLLMELRHHD